MPGDEVPIVANEKLILLVNEHWMIFVRTFLLYFVGIALSGFLFWLGYNLHIRTESFAMVLVILSYLVFLLSHHWLFIYLLSLELSGWAITEKRVIEFQFLPYVRHNMSYNNIAEITESEKHQEGIVKNLLHYGEVELNLTASRQTIEFKYVPYPGIFVETLNRLQETHHHEEPA